MNRTPDEIEAHLMAHIVSLAAGQAALEQLVGRIAQRSGVAGLNGQPLRDLYMQLQNDALQRMLVDIEKADPAFSARVTNQMRGINNGAGPFPS